MIYTLTFSPSIDYYVYLDTEFVKGRMNRMSSDEIYYGGKGVNVSQVLLGLGVDNTALGFVAGFTGREIEEGLRAKGLKTDFVHLRNGRSRINIKLKSDVESEINAKSPRIDASDMTALLEKIDNIGKDDILVIAGSLPDDLDRNLPMHIIERLSSRETKVIADTQGESLYKILSYRPFLVKPNHIELSELFNEEFSPNDRGRIEDAAKKLQMNGARNVLVSMGSEGALLVTEDRKVYSAEAPNGMVRNTVGSGDSMIAGFITGFMENNDFEDAFIMGIAAGSATAFSDGLATGDEIRDLYRLIR
ncbi:MAG: 1-phosphofructokinase [Lachnospiraceae bacterium]|nr:1-phosphofructokinase [Lachnospiraceae bacterium]